MSYEEDQRLIQNTEKKIAYEEGLEQGTKQEKLEIAKKMLDKKMETSVISELTGVDINILNSL